MSGIQETANSDNNNPTSSSDNANNNVNVSEGDKLSENVPPKKDDPVSPPSSETGSTSSRIPRQSGIKPPSRIGRPCGGLQKPAIPATPTKNSSDDSTRRLTDDFGRHRLTDLLEADESEEDGYYDYYYNRRSASRRKRYSSIGSTASSMEGLWDLHPRRLSEAGLSRHSDSSAVLTEDTDSFMIGQKVWVGGSKPGTIAYIGETQFAPGDWAGIVLDEPIGKNDGSVAGTRYFQCESKKGVFSRLTRLTRVPMELPGMGSSETFTHSTPSPTGLSYSNNGVRRSPISPTGSTRSLLKSTSLSNSNTSLASTSTQHVIDFKLGDRVIIKSTQGSKVGTVRYMGLTDFAPGEWVGVELDDPRGKNDGAVSGKRYFECRPLFGLFAPISKVSKSPSKYKPSGSCVVHSGPGLPPSGVMKRANSKESMASMTSRTSVASNVRRVRLGVTSLTPNINKKVPTNNTSTPLPTRTALQDVLREKQQHIEQLLKERDLERAEITRAASQVDDVEQRLYNVQQEYERHRSDCEQKFKENSELVSHLNVDKNELLAQLEDERRKNEDLLFRFDEVAITQGDVEALNQANVTKIKQLEGLLKDERSKSENLDSVSNKLFETEENLIKSREELDAVRSELDHLRSKRSADVNQNSEIITALRNEIESAKKSDEEKSKTIVGLNENIQKFNKQHQEMSQVIETLKSQSQVTSSNCLEKDQEIERLKKEFADNLIKVESKQSELAKENERLKMELSAKSHDLEVALETVHKHEIEIKTTKHDLETTRAEVKAKQDDLDRYRSNAGESEQSLRSELEKTRSDLKSKITEVETVKKECEVHLSQKKMKLEEANVTISRNNEELKKLTDELIETKAKFEESSNQVHSRHARAVEDRDAQLMALTAELQQKNEEVVKHSIVITKLEDDLCAKNSVIESLRVEIGNLKHWHSTTEENCGKLSQEMNAIRLENGDLQRQLEGSVQRINELLEVKQRLENEMQVVLTSKCDNAELDALRKEIQQREMLIETIKSESLLKIQAAEHSRQECELKSQQTAQDYEKALRGYEDKLRLALDAEAQLKQRCEVALDETSKVRDDLTFRINEVTNALKEKELLLSSLHGQTGEKEQFYKDQLARVTDELNKNIQSCQDKIGALTGESVQLRTEISKKSDEVIEANAKHSQLVAQTQQMENELRQMCTEKVRDLEFQVNEKNAQLEQTAQELHLLRNDCQSSNTDLESKNRDISELTLEVNRSRDLIVQLQDQLSQAKSNQDQFTRRHDQVQVQCQDLLQQVAILSQKAQLVDELQEKLKVEHDNFLNLINRLKVTDSQKEKYMKQLQEEVAASGDGKCRHLLDILSQVQTSGSVDENVQKIITFEHDLQVLRHNLADRNAQFEAQKQEILRLQEDLLKTQQSCVVGRVVPGGVVADDGVRNILHPINLANNFPHVTPINPSNPTQVQVQLTVLQNSVLDLTKKFRQVNSENNDLLTRLQLALRNCYHTRSNNKNYSPQSFENSKHLKDLDSELNNDRYNLQRVIQNTLIQLQQKDHHLSVVQLRFNNLQNKLRNLPVQCKQYVFEKNTNENSGSFVAHSDNNDCAEISLENHRIQKLLVGKDNRMLELQNTIGNLLNLLQQKQQNINAPNWSVDSGHNVNGGSCQPKVVIKEVPKFIERLVYSQSPRLAGDTGALNILNNDLNTCKINLKRKDTTISILEHKSLDLGNLVTNLKFNLNQCSGNNNQMRSVLVPSDQVMYKNVPIASPPKVIIKNVCLSPSTPKVIVKYVDRNTGLPAPQYSDQNLYHSSDCRDYKVILNQKDQDLNNLKNQLAHFNSIIGSLRISFNECQNQLGRMQTSPSNGIVGNYPPTKVVVKYVDRNVCVREGLVNGLDVSGILQDLNSCQSIIRQKDTFINNLKKKSVDLKIHLNQCLRNSDRSKLSLPESEFQYKEGPIEQPPKVIVRNVCLTPNGPQNNVNFGNGQLINDLNNCKLILNQKHSDNVNLQKKLYELENLLNNWKHNQQPQRGNPRVAFKEVPVYVKVASPPKVQYVDRNVCIPPPKLNGHSNDDALNVVRSCKLIVNQKDQMILNLRQNIVNLNGLISNLKMAPNSGPSIDNCKLILSNNDQIIKKQQQTIQNLHNILNNRSKSQVPEFDNNESSRSRFVPECTRRDLEENFEVIQQLKHKIVLLQNLLAQFNSKNSHECEITLNKKNDFITSLKKRITELQNWIGQLEKKGPSQGLDVILVQNQQRIYHQQNTIVELQNIVARLQDSLNNKPTDNCREILTQNKIFLNERDRKISELQDLLFQMKNSRNQVQTNNDDQCKLILGKRDQLINKLQNQLFVQGNVITQLRQTRGPLDEDKHINLERIIADQNRKIGELQKTIENLPSTGSCKLLLARNENLINQLNKRIVVLQTLLQNNNHNLRSGNDCKTVIDRDQSIIQQQNYKINQMQQIISQLTIHSTAENYKILINKNNELINQQTKKITYLENLVRQLQNAKSSGNNDCDLLLNRNDILINQLKRRILDLQNAIQVPRGRDAIDGNSCKGVENNYQNLLGQQNSKINQLLNLIVQLKSSQNGGKCDLLLIKNNILINQQKQRITEFENLLLQLNGSYGSQCTDVINRKQQIITEQNNRLDGLQNLIVQLKSDNSKENYQYQINQYQNLINQLRKRVDELQGIVIHSQSDRDQLNKCRFDQNNGKQIINQQNSKIDQLLHSVSLLKAQNNAKNCDINSDTVIQLKKQISYLNQQSSHLQVSIQSCNNALNGNDKLVKRLNDKIYVLQTQNAGAANLNQNLQGCKLNLGKNENVIEQQNFKISQLLQLVAQLKASQAPNVRNGGDSDLVKRLKDRLFELEGSCNDKSLGNSSPARGDCLIHQHLLDKERSKVGRLEDLLANVQNNGNCNLILQKNNNIIGQLQNRIVTLQNLLSHSQAPSDLTAHIKQCQSSNNNLQVKVDQDAGKINELMVLISRLRAQLSACQFDEGKNVVINQLNDQNNRHHITISNLQGNVKSCKKVVEGNEQLINQLNYRISQMQNQQQGFESLSGDLNNCKLLLNKNQEITSELNIKNRELENRNTGSCKLLMAQNDVLINQLKKRIGELENLLISNQNKLSGDCKVVLQQNHMVITQQNTKISQLQQIISELQFSGGNNCDANLVSDLQIKVKNLQNELDQKPSARANLFESYQCKDIENRYQQLLYQQDYRINQLQILVSRLQSQTQNRGDNGLNLKLINQHKLQIHNLQTGVSNLEGNLRKCNSGDLNKEKLINVLNMKIVDLQTLLRGQKNLNGELKSCKIDLHNDQQLIDQLKVKHAQLQNEISEGHCSGDGKIVAELKNVNNRQTNKIHELEMLLSKLPKGSESCVFYQQIINQQNSKINQFEELITNLTNKDLIHQLRKRIDDLETVLKTRSNSGNNLQLYYDSCRTDQIHNRQLLGSYSYKINQLLSFINNLRNGSNSHNSNADLINTLNQQRLELGGFQNMIVNLKKSLNNCQVVVNGNEQLINQLNFRIQQLQVQSQRPVQSRNGINFNENCNDVLNQKTHFITEQNTKINQLQTVISQLQVAKNCKNNQSDNNLNVDDEGKNKLIDQLKMRIVELQHLITRRPSAPTHDMSLQLNDCKSGMISNQQFIDQQSYRINQLQVLVNNLQSQLNLAGNCKVNENNNGHGNSDNNLHNLIQSLRSSLDTCEKNSNIHEQTIHQLQIELGQLRYQNQPGNRNNNGNHSEMIVQYSNRITQLVSMLNELKLQCNVDGNKNSANDNLIDQQRQHIIKLEYDNSRLKDLVGNCRKGGESKLLINQLNRKFGELDRQLQLAGNELNGCRLTVSTNKQLINQQENKIGQLEHSLIRLKVPDNSNSYKVIINRNNVLINQLKNRVTELENLLGRLQSQFSRSAGDCVDVKDQYQFLINQQNNRISQLQFMISKLKSPDNEGSYSLIINRNNLMIDQYRNRIRELELLLQHQQSAPRASEVMPRQSNCTDYKLQIQQLNSNIEQLTQQSQPNSNDNNVKENLINQQRNEILMLQKLVHRLEVSKDNCVLNGNNETTLQLKSTIDNLQLQLNNLAQNGNDECRTHLAKYQEFIQNQNLKINELQQLIGQLQVPTTKSDDDGKNNSSDSSMVNDDHVNLINKLETRLAELEQLKVDLSGPSGGSSTGGCLSYQQVIKDQSDRINQLLNLITHPQIAHNSKENNVEINKLQNRIVELENINKDFNSCKVELNHKQISINEQSQRLISFQNQLAQNLSNNCTVLIDDYKQQIQVLQNLLNNRPKVDGDCSSIIQKKNQQIDERNQNILLLQGALNQLKSSDDSQQLANRCRAIIDQNDSIMDQQKRRIIELQHYLQKVQSTLANVGECKMILNQKDQLIIQQQTKIDNLKQALMYNNDSNNNVRSGNVNNCGLVLLKYQQMINQLTGKVRDLEGALAQLEANPDQFKLILSRNQQLIHQQNSRIVELQNIIAHLQVPAGDNNNCKALYDQNHELQTKFNNLREVFVRLQGSQSTGSFNSREKCKYRKMIKILRNQVHRLVAVRDRSPPVVPPPFMHVSKSVGPTGVVVGGGPSANNSLSRAKNAASVIESLHNVYKHTQEALTHCMDTVLAQKFAVDNSLCNNNVGQLEQDKEFAENQIRFLNSIIVDIQRKNEEQKARIEILESGCSPAFADDLRSMDVTQRKLPPRVYCDICEEFDLHETEDCPQQDADLMPPPPQPTKLQPHENRTKREVSSEERPYCEICGVFGHLPTEECQEDETF